PLGVIRITSKISRRFLSMRRQPQALGFFTHIRSMTTRLFAGPFSVPSMCPWKTLMTGEFAVSNPRQPTAPMPPGLVISSDEFLRNPRDSGFWPKEVVNQLAETHATGAEGEALARSLFLSGKLPPHKVDAIRNRRFHEVLIGNYEVLAR